jgi:hypothetical protein
MKHRPIRVGIDQGVNHKILKALIISGDIEACQVHDLERIWPFTTKIGNGFRAGVSAIGGLDRIVGEDWAKVLSIVGHTIDAQHVYGAHMAGCTYFLTNDRDDILNKRDRLELIIKPKILTLEEFVQEIAN